MNTKDLKVLETHALAGMTPQQLHQRTMALRRKDASQLVIALSSEAFVEFMASTSFMSMIDVETKIENVQKGLVGTLLGLPVVTDSFVDKPFLPEGISVCYRVASIH